MSSFLVRTALRASSVVAAAPRFLRRSLSAATPSAHGHAADAHAHGDAHGHGDHGHGHGGDPRAESHLFGEHPPHAGEQRAWGEWEAVHYATMAGLALVGAGALYRQNTNPHDWARDEAEERNRRRAAGLPVEFGVNYAALRFMKENGAITAEQAEALEAGALPVAPEAGSLRSSKAD